MVHLLFLLLFLVVSGNDDTINVLWMAPFFSGGGYCDEAISMAMSLHDISSSLHIRIDHHGDSFSQSFIEGLDYHTKDVLSQLYYTRPQPLSETIVICHSEPGAWVPANYKTSDCPPQSTSEKPLLLIGRTMFETNRLPGGWESKLNNMDRIWVPTFFHKNIFIEGNVDEDKIIVIPEPVDTDFFSPYRELPRFEFPGDEDEDEAIFKFLSIGKWEHRKGFDILLKAYFEEFTNDDKCVLYILTNAYHGDDSFEDKVNKLIQLWLIDNIIISDKFLLNKLPLYRFIPSGVPRSLMPSLYNSVDVFVLPSRGEGWGRPHVEAMSMELGLIATYWSGPTEFMTEDNSFPLKIDGLEDVPEGPFTGHEWATPSKDHLKELMRYNMLNKNMVKDKGKKGRQTMVNKYCLACVGDILEEELRRKYDEIVIS